MSEAKKNGLSANFVDVSSLSLFPPDFPITMRVLGHPFTCTHMCPQCPHLRKIVYNFSTIAYNGVTFSLFFGPFSSIFVDIRLRLGPSPPVLTVLTCPHPPPFSKRILLCSILPHFHLLAKSLTFTCPPMWACPSRVPLPSQRYTTSPTLYPFSQLPSSTLLPNCGLLSPSKQAPEHPLSRPRMPHLYLQSIKYYPPRLNSI